jgi:hypothetical protein
MKSHKRTMKIPWKSQTRPQKGVKSSLLKRIVAIIWFSQPLARTVRKLKPLALLVTYQFRNKNLGHQFCYTLYYMLIRALNVLLFYKFAYAVWSNVAKYYNKKWRYTHRFRFYIPRRKKKKKTIFIFFFFYIIFA